MKRLILILVLVLAAPVHLEAKLKCLLIGIEEYESEKINDFLFVFDTPLKIKEKWLKKTCRELLNPNDIVCLIGEEAGKQNILNHLRELIASLEEDDLGVIFYSAHGLAHNNDFFLFTYDTQPPDYKKTALSLETIAEVIIANITVPANVLLICDACFSGQLIEKWKSIKEMHRVDYFMNLIVSSESDQPSYASIGYEGGVLGYFFVEGLDGAADRNGDGDMTLEELTDYLSYKVPRAEISDIDDKTGKVFLVHQFPQFYLETPEAVIACNLEIDG